MVSERGQKTLFIAPELLVSWLSTSPERTTINLPRAGPVSIPLPPFRAVRRERGLPSGTRCTGAYWDFTTQTLALVMEHETFEPVPDSKPRPVLPATEILIETQDPSRCCWGHECQTCKAARS